VAHGVSRQVQFCMYGRIKTGEPIQDTVPVPSVTNSYRHLGSCAETLLTKQIRYRYSTFNTRGSLRRKKIKKGFSYQNLRWQPVWSAGEILAAQLLFLQILRVREKKSKSFYFLI
jgi:hypothetical protein